MVVISLDEKIKGCCPPAWFIIEKIYGTSGLGQPYVIVVTKCGWYAVRLIVENGSTLCDVYSDHTTMDGVKQKIEEYKESMRYPSPSLYKTHFGLLSLTDKVNSWRISDIPSILKRGDVIARPFLGVFKHGAVYLGDFQVAHIAGESQEDKGARIAPLFGLVEEHPFAAEEGQPFEIISFRFILKSHEDIAQRAEKFANENLWKGEYTVFGRNCMDFVVRCALDMK